MSELFPIGDEIGHVAGDAQRAQRLEEYPERCPGGGSSTGNAG